MTNRFEKLIKSFIEREFIYDQNIKIMDETIMYNDWEIDSLDVVALGLDIYNEYGVEMEYQDFFKNKIEMMSLGEICDYVEKKSKNNIN